MSLTAINDERALYVIFSSTPCRMGKLIRTVTGYEYNHTSISLDPEFKSIYSFARFRKNNPFYGGFVEESCKRFFQNGELANVAIYKIPISEEKYEEITKCFKKMSENRDEYIYNLLSAAFFPVNKRFRAPDTYICIEFAVMMLARYCDCLDIDENEFWTFPALRQKLADYFYYEGPYTEAVTCEEWGRDEFLDYTSFPRKVTDTAIVSGRIVARVVKNRIGQIRAS